LKIRLTTLSENSAGRPGFCAEWGLSFFVEADNRKILFDTGAGNAVLHNADRLGIDIPAATPIVLSHAHADHTGGLDPVLRRTGKTRVIAHPAIWESKFTRRPYEDAATDIGIPYTRQALEGLGADFELSREPVQISENIWTTGEIPMVTSFESIEPIFLVRENGSYRPDTIPDDQALVLRSEKGLVIVLGCAHRGMINTIHHAQAITGEQKVHTIVGGTHLFPKTEAQKDQAIAALRKMGIAKIGVSHCTGFDASMRLSREFGDDFFLNNAGNIYMLD
jgi:7,8-dihydropterin-6-yl-methyl-4-(beta-D-ribofuranosyl)aminobenzene 5'-phosphate synthase